MKRFLVSATLGLAFAASPVHAQIASPAGSSQQDLNIDAPTRKAVVDTLCERVERYYVFADRAKVATKAIRKRFSAHEYDKITSSGDFADSLTAHLQAVVPDLHLRVHYRYEPIPVQSDDSTPTESEQKKMLEMGRIRNYGFERVERLPGNVGYLDLRQFSGDPAGQQTAVAAMNFLSNTDALIIDLRRNGGGSPMMIATILSYFVESGDRLLFNTFYQRQSDNTEQWFTSPYVPGPRYLKKPVYVLISNRTGSAAEEFAYDIQSHKLGTIVGATSAGGANPGGVVRLSEHFAAFIATGRAINPVTKTNWEGVGVKPDSAVTAGEAMKFAYARALDGLIESNKADQDRVDGLKGALADASKRASDPEDEFLRRRR